MAKVKIYKISKDGKVLRGSIDEERLNDPAVIADGWKQGELAPAPPAPPAAPAAAPEKPGFYESYVKPALENPFVVGMERGATAEFAPAIAGASSLLASKIMSPAEGVAPEFLNQEDWFARGREEQKSLQQKNQEESPWLTGLGAVTGAGLTMAGLAAAAPAAGVPALTMAPRAGLLPGSATAARIAQALPGALGYGAATGVGRTDIVDTPDSLKDKTAELAGNVALDTALAVPSTVIGQTLLPAAGRLLSRPLTAAQQWADRALLAKGGPGFAAQLEDRTLGAIDPNEAVRVVRETNIGRGLGPEAVQKNAAEVRKGSGDILGRIRAEVDRQATALRGRSEQSRLAGQAKQTELTAKYADKVKAAEAGAKNAAEIEAAANKAATDLDAQKEAFIKASSETKQLPEGDVAQLSIRSTVAASKVLDVKQREVDMMKAAAKKAREEANRLAKEAAPSSYEHAQSQMDIIEAERLGGEAAKKTISGKKMAEILRAEAEGLTIPGMGKASVSGAKDRSFYNALVAEAKALENSGEMSLEEANKKIAGLRKTARWDRSIDTAAQAPAEAAKSATRALSEGERAAVGQAETTPELADILASRYSRVGRGKSIETPPTPEEALGSAKRAYQVAGAFEKSAEEEAKRIADMGTVPSLKSLSAEYGPSLTSAAAEKTAGGLSALQSTLSGSPLPAQSYLEMLDAIQKSYEEEPPQSMVQQ